MADHAPDLNAAKIATLQSLCDGMTKAIEKRKSQGLSVDRETKMLTSYGEQIKQLQNPKAGK